MSRHSRPLPRALLLAAIAAVLATPAAALPALDASRGEVPESVPDRGPVLSEPMVRGALLTAEAADRPTTAKTIDGDAGDWVGESSRIGGTARFDAGEHIHADYVHDAWGADDGDDADRLALTGAAADLEARTTRLDQMFQALGSQFGAPDPVGADEAYGDHLANDVADMIEVRWATSTADTLDLLVPVSNLTDAAALGVLVLADTDAATDGATGGSAGTSADVALAGLTTERFDTALLLTDGAVRQIDLATQTLTDVTTATAVVDADGWTNTLEARLPRDLLAPDGTLRVAVVSGRWDGMTLTPANVAYRDAEPVAGMYNDQRQALGLLAGSVDGWTAEVDVTDLESGRTQDVHPGPGYHERTFASAPGISAELRADLDDIYEDTVWQRYALFVPSAHDPAAPSPLTFWLHYRGGKSHSGGAWSPRLFTQLGEESDTIVVTPHGRGERRWYEGSSHQDFWEVYADVHDLFPIDPARRYLSGYSMGGHGSPMMALLYPDLFAGAYLQAGAIGSNLLDVAVNARHTPFWFDASAQDPLVAINQQMALELNGLGYRYVAQTFVAGEHYTQAILDEWAAGARYLRQQTLPANPRQVTYRVVPSLIETINDGRGEPASIRYAPDGAWWVQDIQVVEGAQHGTVDAVAHTLPGEVVTPTIDLGDVQPGDHSVASVRHGQGWAGTTADIAPLVEVDLTDVAAVTLDAGRWDLQPGSTMVEITSTQPARVTLTGLREGTITLDVQAGLTTVPLTIG